VKLTPTEKPKSIFGSGFVVFDRRHVATAWHVVNELESSYDVAFLDGTTVLGRPVAVDAVNDLAILELTR